MGDRTQVAEVRPHHSADGLRGLVEEIGRCRLCAESLPLGPRPVVRLSAAAPILIIGQAPGTRVHETGLPWNDASGDRLRIWLGMDRETFYDRSVVSVMPMGFCYPGVDAKGGDRPPRPECAPLWHARALAHLSGRRLTLLVGQWAQKAYLRQNRWPGMTETVRAAERFLPAFLPLPHPSWRNTAWLKRNPWFAQEILPLLRSAVAAARSGSTPSPVAAM